MNRQIKILVTCALCFMTTWVAFCFLQARQYKKNVYDPYISKKHFIFFTARGKTKESSFQILSQNHTTFSFKDSSGEYFKGPNKKFYKLTLKGKSLWEVSFLGVPGPTLLTKKYIYIGTLNGSLYCLNKQHRGNCLVGQVRRYTLPRSC